MIEENALVVASDGNKVWVEVQKQSACGKCASNKGCGGSILENFFGNRSKVLRVSSDIHVNVGDEVVIGVNENAVLKGSFVVYALPLIVILAFALIGETFVKQWLSVGGDATSMLGALVGLVVSVIGLRWYSHNASKRGDYLPIILRQVANSANVDTQYNSQPQYKMLS